MLAWLSVWSEMQTCIWPSWYTCHSLSLASVKSRSCLPFWYRLTWVVPDKGPLNVCVCVLFCSDTLLFRCWPWQWHAAFRKCRAAYNSLFYRDLWKFMAWRLPSMWHHQREKNSQHCRQQPGSQCGFAASGLRRPILPMSPAIWRKSNIWQNESWTRWFNQKQVCVHLPTYVDNVALPAFARCWAANFISYLLGKVAEAGLLLWTYAGTHRQHTMWAVVITRIIKLPLLLHPFKGLFSRTPR